MVRKVLTELMGETAEGCLGDLAGELTGNRGESACVSFKAVGTSDGLSDHTIKVSNMPDVLDALTLVDTMIKAKGD